MRKTVKRQRTILGIVLQESKVQVADKAATPLAQASAGRGACHRAFEIRDHRMDRCWLIRTVLCLGLKGILLRFVMPRLTNFCLEKTIIYLQSLCVYKTITMAM
ncbi:hypothetical protein C8R34_12026 [Nitrosomonas sp. Nm84]|uniref:hypothetical protein n=1 Tax=Nitrosomonas sp. Nm84 TaxID=200124 RepID=UPI000D761A76|nr:hypothetical protein C8R34_12026 [Nitrosomonas sp. Nm84]